MSDLLFFYCQGKYIYETGSKNGKRVQSNMVCLELVIIFNVPVLQCEAGLKQLMIF